MALLDFFNERAVNSRSVVADCVIVFLPNGGLCLDLHYLLLIAIYYVGVSRILLLNLRLSVRIYLSRWICKLWCDVAFFTFSHVKYFSVYAVLLNVRKKFLWLHSVTAKEYLFIFYECCVAFTVLFCVVYSSSKKKKL